jgi:hypothetical protein
MSETFHSGKNSRWELRFEAASRRKIEGDSPYPAAAGFGATRDKDEKETGRLLFEALSYPQAVIHVWGQGAKSRFLSKESADFYERITFA